jgi:hypothetical protein
LLLDAAGCAPSHPDACPTILNLRLAYRAQPEEPPLLPSANEIIAEKFDGIGVPVCCPTVSFNHSAGDKGVSFMGVWDIPIRNDAHFVSNCLGRGGGGLNRVHRYARLLLIRRLQSEVGELDCTI